MSEDVRMSLEIPAETAFACPVAGLANVLAERTGFGQRERYRFQLTVEEFCLCLAELAEGKSAAGRRFYRKTPPIAGFVCLRASTLSLGALNITSRASAVATAASAAEVGLLLAGKAADRIRLKHQGSDRFLLEAEVDRAYPEASPVRIPEEWRPPFVIRSDSDAAQLTQAAALAISAYPPWQCPSASGHPPSSRTWWPTAGSLRPGLRRQGANRRTDDVEPVQ